MKRVLARALAVAWAAVGCIGIGIGVGYWWLDRALTHGDTAKPTIRLVAPMDGDRGAACAFPQTMAAFPQTMAAFTQAFGRTAHGDLRQFTEEVFRCAESDASRRAFIRMLVDARRSGDAIADRALERIADIACAALADVADTAPARIAATVQTCRDIATRSAAPADPHADAVRAQVFQFAQRLTLVTAGIADHSTRAALCADAEALPTDALDRLRAARADLADVIARACGEPSGSVDAGAPE